MITIKMIVEEYMKSKEGIHDLEDFAPEVISILEQSEKYKVLIGRNVKTIERKQNEHGWSHDETTSNLIRIINVR